MSIPGILNLQSTRTLLTMSTLLGDCFRNCNCQLVYNRKKSMLGMEHEVFFFSITVMLSPKAFSTVVAPRVRI